MYESPINMIYGQLQTQIEGEIMRAVQKVYVHVDKDELLRALQYDREQYDRGFADGYQNAKYELFRCKDCKHFVQGEPYDPCECMKWKVKFGVAYTEPDGYCHKGERKDND